MRTPAPLVFLVLCLVGAAASAQEKIVNGDFEQDAEGWGRFWARSGEGIAKVQSDAAQQGKRAVHIQYSGPADWSYPQSQPLAVQPGDIYELSGWLRKRGAGKFTLSVILYDANQQAISWSYGGRDAAETDQWQRVQTRFAIPRGGATIVPRLMGYGPSECWADNLSLSKTGTIAELQSAKLPSEVTAASDKLAVTFHPDHATLTVKDLRTGRIFSQQSNNLVTVLSAKQVAGGIDFQLLKPDDVQTVSGTIRLDDMAAEFTVELQSSGAMQGVLQFPNAFNTQSGEYLILPVNEGISYPVDDSSLDPMHYHLYGGHGLCMSFWGSTDLTHGLLAIIETPDDAAVRVSRRESRLVIEPEWQPQRGQFGSPRRIRYVSVDTGGYVAMCKRYRQYAQQTGLFKTLAQKRAENPNVDLLVGAVNVWCWDRSAPDMCREMRELGIDRILWSNRTKPDEIRRLNEMGVLSSRYDIYQDLMDPAKFPQLAYVHGDWTSEGWPRDVVRGADGNWVPGWAIESKKRGEWFHCAVLCDTVAVDYARRRVPQELETHPYKCRFIDTTTASEWRECYDPKHPMTRTDCKQHRMELLEYMSKTAGLVTGSETGHDAAVPYLHYFEGMLSLGPYRVPDAGRDMQRAWTEVPAKVAKFQTGHMYRLPLWELVYHDCVVAQWYWGDYNNKLPSLWQRRDLLNALYGTPPMFMFNREVWQANRERFAESYRIATPVARATGYSEMLSHRWLTADHAVQQTEFGNGTVVTVNFGDEPYTLPDGSTLAPLTHHWTGLPEGTPPMPKDLSRISYRIVVGRIGNPSLFSWTDWQSVLHPIRQVIVLQP